MQERHTDRRRYFEEQALTTARFVLPFVEPFVTMDENSRLLEVGCGEGGNLRPFLDRGVHCTGVDLRAPQIERAREFMADHPYFDRLTLVADDIYHTTPEQLGRFDLIMLRDVIEHIHDQGRFLRYIQPFLRPGGRLFIGFPPWSMPFGGHQQICRSGLLSKLPYFHLLPRPLYKAILESFGEPAPVVEELLEIKETGLSIERLRRLIAESGWRIDREQLYLINPNYETKFGLRPREQWPVLAALPGVRNLVTTCGYYVLGVG